MNEEAKKYLDLIYEEPEKFGEWLGFGNFLPIHREWLKMMLFNEEDETLLAHRGSYKTTCLTIAIAFHLILFPNKTIIFLRKTDTDVKEVINQVSKILHSSLFQHIVHIIYGKALKLIEDSTFNITTNLMTSTKGSSQLLGLGINTSITGKHADLVITDDIVNIQDRISKAKRDLTKTAYMELQNIKNRGGRILNTGTPWHKEDAITDMPNKHIYTCYDTGLMTREQIEEIRHKMTSSLFAANYELKHIADEEAMFTNPIFTNKTELIYNGFVHIDASYGGEDGTALTIGKEVKYIDNEGKQQSKYIFLGKRWSKHVDDCLNEIEQIIKKYKGGSIDTEKNADKGYLAKEINKRSGIYANEPYHENMNKYIKISTYLRAYWNKIEWLEDTDPDYMNEILDYTENAEHDDSPDSASSMMRKFVGKGKWVF